jgi:very-short-patch-repair endonuclease
MFINPEFGTSVHRLESSLRDIDDLFSVDRNLELQFELETEPGRALTYLRLMAEDIEQIDIATDFDDACEEMRSLGLSDVLDYLVHHKVGSQQLASTVIKAISAVWIESIFASDQKRLAPLDRTGRDQAVTDFREIDRKLKFDAASRIADSANNRRPKALIGPVGIIQKQASLKTRHMRIAELLEKTSEVAQSAVPCFMMSPISVSTFLPSTMKFDTVIFDEASQMLTSSAINAIYRARQLIIAGDERQLPPTSFFSRGLDEDDGDEYVEDGIDDFESVLHQAKSGGLEQIGLRWHYRSRHESLITYSNYSFYDGQLVTYPSAIQDSPELGVSFVHVPNGIYKRSGSRTNTIEAQKVVERVLYFADHHPELSLGVVTLSAQQKTEIENQLDAALRVRPDLEEYFTADRLHGVFVKNLESVQGDERDVIIFSVGYGKDENGKLTMNFGPVNIKGGWRRLNVAFTRARNRMELVASIAAGDFSDTANPNVNHLKRYFDYAVRGPSALAFEVGESNLGPESPFEEEVIQVIRLLGYDPVPQVGQAGYRIDMAIKDPKNPGSFVLGIECDGAAYHSSRVARDRDRLRQDVLEGLGWNLYRIWGPTWYRNRKQAERDLHSAISAAVQSKRTIVSSKPEVSRTSIQHTTTDVEFTELSDFVRPYFLPNRRWDVPLNTNATGHVTPIGIQQFILAVVKEEGPVSINLVKRRFAIAAGWNLTKAVQADLERRIKRMIRDKELLKVKPECLILPRELDFVARKPDETDELTKRDASNVAYIEIGAAIVNFLRLASPIDLSEIEQLVVKSVFGWDRVTAKWKDAIGETISALAAHGWWSVVGDQICKGGNFPHTATTVTFK